MRNAFLTISGTLAALLLTPARPLTVQAAPAPYKYLLSTGPFGLPVEAQNLDWVIYNASPDTQSVQLTGWRLNAEGPRAKLEAGSLTLRIPPGRTVQSGASTTSTVSFYPGYFYEVTVAVNDRRVLPTVQLSSDRRSHLIPGTRIGPRDFVELQP